MFNRDDEQISSINIIPFVDIILVVLIIFMVTAPQFMKEGFSIQLPQSLGESQSISSTQLDIEVSYTGDIFLEGNLISIKELSFYAKKMTEQNSEVQVVISADKSASHGRVMEIVQTIKFSGVQNFMFATSSK